MSVIRKGRTQRQIAAECSNRLLLAYEYRRSGLTLRQVGEKLGVSAERARQMVAKHERAVTA